MGQTRRNNENVLTFDKLFKKEDSLPPIKKTEVNPGWVKITKDKNNNISKIYGKSLNEPEIIELLKFKEAQYESELKIDNLNKNIQKSQECDENRFIPIDSLYYEDSFNNDELYEEEDIIEKKYDDFYKINFSYLSIKFLYVKNDELIYIKKIKYNLNSNILTKNELINIFSKIEF